MQAMKGRIGKWKNKIIKETMERKWPEVKEKEYFSAAKS